MHSWLDKPGSLNWANREKLSEEINKLEKKIGLLKENLYSLCSAVDQLDTHCKNLLDLKKNHLLTANHIIHLKPLHEEVDILQKAIELICKLQNDFQIEGKIQPKV